MKLEAYKIGTVGKWIEEWFHKEETMSSFRWLGFLMDGSDKLCSTRGSTGSTLCSTILLNYLEDRIASYVSKFADATKVVHIIRSRGDI